MKLAQVRLPVDDLPGCFRFLRDSLGLEPSFGSEDEDHASFAAGDGTIAIFRRADQADVVDRRVSGDSALVVLAVDDVDAEVARLGKAVVQRPVDQPGWSGRAAYLRDPDGNLFELSHVLEAQ